MSISARIQNPEADLPEEKEGDSTVAELFKRELYPYLTTAKNPNPQEIADRMVSVAFTRFDLPIGVDELRKIAHEMVVSQERAIQSAPGGRRGQERDLKVSSEILQGAIRRAYQVKVQENLSRYLQKFTDYIFQKEGSGESFKNRGKFMADGMIKLLDDLALLGIGEEALALLERDVEGKGEVENLNRAFKERISALIQGFPDLEIGVSALKKSMEAPQGEMLENTRLKDWIENLFRILKYPYGNIKYRKESFRKDKRGVTWGGLARKIDEAFEKGEEEVEKLLAELPNDFLERRKTLIEAIAMEPPDPARILKKVLKEKKKIDQNGKNGNGNGHAHKGHERKRGPGSKRKARIKRKR